MRSQENLVCVVTKNGKPRRVSRLRAEEIVDAGGQFISRTRFKALTSGVNVPDKLFKKGDRAVKDFIAQQLKSKPKAEETEGEPKKNKKPRHKKKAKTNA